MDKTNLMRKVAELDDMVKTLIGTRNTHHVPQSSRANKVYLPFATHHFTMKLSVSLLILWIAG